MQTTAAMMLASATMRQASLSSSSRLLHQSSAAPVVAKTSVLSTSITRRASAQRSSSSSSTAVRSSNNSNPYANPVNGWTPYPPNNPDMVDPVELPTAKDPPTFSGASEKDVWHVLTTHLPCCREWSCRIYLRTRTCAHLESLPYTACVFRPFPCPQARASSLACKLAHTYTCTHTHTHMHARTCTHACTIMYTQISRENLYAGELPKKRQCQSPLLQ